MYKSISLSIFLILKSHFLFAQENWSTTDLRVTQFRNGDSIVKATDPESWMKTWDSYIPAYSCPDGDCSKGYLYNWAAVNDPRGLAPKGYKIPSADDFRKLDKNQFFQSANGWINPGKGNYFNAYPKGNLSLEGNTYFSSGYAAYYWSNSKGMALNSIGFVISDSTKGCAELEMRREDFCSVRCMKNENEVNAFLLAEEKNAMDKIPSGDQAGNKDKIKSTAENANSWSTNDGERELIKEKRTKEKEQLIHLYEEQKLREKLSGIKRPFTGEILNEFNLTSLTIKKVQFYTSSTITLEPLVEKKENTINSGNLYSVKRSDSRIIIPINTPCVVDNVSSTGAMTMRFGSCTGCTLTFTKRNPNHSRYYVEANWKNNLTGGIVTYMGKKYLINSASGNVYLMIKMKRIKQSSSRQRVVNGMKI